jgi:hypothetical protein
MPDIRCVIIAGMILVFITGVMSAAVPPCANPLDPNHPYHGPITPGNEMGILYPVGTYDLWYAELPLTFGSSSEADYRNWDWKKIKTPVTMKQGKSLYVLLGMTGDVDGPEDWILDYSDKNTGKNVGEIFFRVGKSLPNQYAVILC